ncbi:flippase-like domain-containing protein [Terrimonas sp. NA20]|uniref:Flippase-like domain-containing protein n=1 Tax=Terrimonas ginsenosidimutans TaxID=2908004 RepID=A0ABS9KQD2_9BACT|nr:lysylphosphatidylglycerol synthase domain-containing protein [Terrimonas ginsenosidimutans]MCG2614540.1 flippase-like domain-containing protein [Terrimonas ginsenosidimutans]
MPGKIIYNKRFRYFINYFLGPLLFIWLSYSIFRQIANQPGLEESWQHIKVAFDSHRVWLLLAVMLLMLVNWSIETVKWKLAVQRVQRIDFVTALKAVMSGVSFSVLTPNRVGEYLGRVLYMEEGKRLKAISLTITGSISQLIITLLMGFISLLVMGESVIASGMITSLWFRIIIYGVLIALVILTLFYFRLAVLVKWIDRLPVMRKYSWLLDTLENFNATVLLQLLSLSAVRFAVFIIQYFLLFRLFEVDVTWWQGWWAVSLSFLVMAVIPTIALFTDLGLRGKVSLQLLGLFSSNQLGISLTALSIWFINLIVPAVVGSLLILSIRKIFRNKSDQKVGEDPG